MESEEVLVLQHQSFNEADVAEKSPCGRYLRYKKIMGRGAFKDVYKGFDQISNTEIAWNQICIEDETVNLSAENQTTFCSEAVLLKSLNHNNVMKCHSFWVDERNRTVNMISELFPSGSLRQYMKKLGNIDLQTIKNWGKQILQGLNYLHTQNPRIIHRDLKCDNIFLDSITGEVKIGDFGLATTMEEGQGPLRALAGTPEFMAPEYYDEEYDELVDIYAFGLCLMELATGEYPYAECTNPAQVFKKVSSGIKPSALSKVKDPEVKQIIEKCLLPASLRESAMELLKDPFFESGNGEVDFDELETGSCLSLEVAFGVESMDRLLSEEDHRVVKDYRIDDSVLSDISALYESSLTVSDACKSSMGDVSMKSNITYDSSSAAVSKDLCFFTSL